MAKKSTALSTVVILPPKATQEVGKLLPRKAFEGLKFWRKLKEREQETIVSETMQLAAANLMQESGKLAMGKHFAEIKRVLEPYTGAFPKFCSRFKFTERTARRYIDAYTNAAGTWPEAVLKAAVARGMDILGYTPAKPLGKYTAAYEALRMNSVLPPKQEEPEEVSRYLDTLEKTRREIQADPEKNAAIRKRLEKRQENIEEEQRRDPDWLLKASYRNCKNALRRVSARKKRAWLDSLVGMLLTEMSISHQTSFKPEAIPDDFRQGRGRPSLVETDTAQSA